jgi:hypothetical protein
MYCMSALMATATHSVLVSSAEDIGGVEGGEVGGVEESQLGGVEGGEVGGVEGGEVGGVEGGQLGGQTGGQRLDVRTEDERLPTLFKNYTNGATTRRTSPSTDGRELV